VQAHNYEAGVRARMTKTVSLEGSVYRLVKYDDILSYRDPLDGLTTVVNAGETRHEGLELALTVRPAPWVEAAASISRARHTYEEWLVDPQAGIDYSGQVMESAPETLGGISLVVTPNDRTGLSADLTRVGGYWMDALNTQRYGGHTLLNLRGELALSRRLAVFARVLNVTNRRFAEGASYTIQRGRELAPGMPRTGYVGLSVEWKR
jgi:iron complex outermembrane receptor protein